MAKTTIEIDVNTGDSAKSLSDLRNEFKDIQKQLSGLTPGTEEYINALKRLGAVKDDIGDLKDEINAFAGADKKIAAVTNVMGGLANGFQAAQGAAALFGQDNEALNKTMVNLQATMAITQGVQGLAGMGDSLKAVGNILKSTTIGTKVATTAQRIYNAVMKDNPIAWLIMGLTALVGVIALVVNAMGDEDEAQKEVIANREKELQLMQEADKAMQKETDFRKSLAEAQGKSAQELAALNEELSKQRIKRIDEEIKTANKLFKDRLVLMKNTSGDEYIELQKANSDTLKLMKDLANERLDIQRNLQIQNAKLETEANKASAEKSKQRVIEKKEESNKEFEDALAEAERLSNIEIEKEKKLEEQRAARLKQMRDQEIAEQIKADEEYGKLLEEKAKKEEEEEKKALENKKKAKEQEVALTLQGLQSIQSLADAFAGKSEASQKKAFQIKKAASLAQATIETYQAAQSAFASQMAIPTPDAPIRANIAAAIAIASGLARVAVIAKTKFEGGGGGASGGGGGGNLGTFSQGGGGGQPPQGLTAQNTVTQLNPDGTVAGQGNREAAPMKAYVVESESRAVTERVNKLSNNSKIG
jgi:chemotaxis protein histidine kinase CheA